jgi:hypothetical protein
MQLGGKLSKGAVVGAELGFVVESLHGVQVYLNRPGKEVLGNLGGLRTCLPLIAKCLPVKQPLSESEYEQADQMHRLHTLLGLIQCIYSLLMNNSIHAVNFLVGSHGLLMLRHLLEKVCLRYLINAACEAQLIQPQLCQRAV